VNKSVVEGRAEEEKAGVRNQRLRTGLRMKRQG
jgi:hypothetical protein